jgi:hypothetical protein
MPPLPPIIRPRERLNLALGTLELLKLLTDALLPGRPKGASYECVICYLAVMLAHTENRWHGAEKIGITTGLPPSTVARKAQVLVDYQPVPRLLKVHGNYCLNPDWANSDDAREFLGKVMAHQVLWLRAGEHATKMDTLLENAPILAPESIFAPYLDPVPR